MEQALAQWTDEPPLVREQLSVELCHAYCAVDEPTIARRFAEEWSRREPDRAAPLIGLGDILTTYFEKISDIERAIVVLERACELAGAARYDADDFLADARDRLAMERAQLSMLD
jgi:hypothetical protein